MKKTTILLVTLMAILIAGLSLVVLMATGILEKGTDDGIIINSGNDNERPYIIYGLVKSDIDVSEIHTGIVKYTSEASTSYQQHNIGSKFKMLVKPGDVLKKGDTLYYDNDGKAVVAKNDLMVVALDIGTDMYMEVFMYDESQICLSIPAKYQDRLSDIKFKTISEGGQEITLELVGITPYVTDGKIDVALKNEFQVLESTEIEVIATYYTINDKIRIPAEYVFFSNGEPYVHIVDGIIDDYYLDVYDRTDDYYIVNDELDGVSIGYTLEEIYMNENGR